MLRGKLKIVMAGVLLAGVTREFAGGMMHNAFSPSAAGAPVDDTDSMKLLAEKALKAGGGEKLQAVKAWTFTEKLRGKTSTYRRYVQLPDRFRTESEHVADGKLYKSVYIINGDKGWTVSDGKVEEMPAEAVAGWKQGHFWVSAPLLGPRLLSDATSKVTKLPGGQDRRADSGRSQAASKDAWAHPAVLRQGDRPAAQARKGLSDGRR